MRPYIISGILKGILTALAFSVIVTMLWYSGQCGFGGMFSSVEECSFFEFMTRMDGFPLYWFGYHANYSFVSLLMILASVLITRHKVNKAK
jgi:hypothetical protein